jgi:hypothetical protein
MEVCLRTIAIVLDLMQPDVAVWRRLALDRHSRVDESRERHHLGALRHATKKACRGAVGGAAAF